MNQEPNLEELFSNYHPTLSDSDAFMQALSRRLDAVQYVERYQAAQAARYRRYIVIALLVGLVLGGVSLAVFLFLAPSAQFFTFRVQSDVLLLINSPFWSAQPSSSSSVPYLRSVIFANANNVCLPTQQQPGFVRNRTAEMTMTSLG